MSCSRYVDHTGQRFGHLVVVKPVDNSGGDCKPKYWECICDCGKMVYVAAKHLVDGSTTQCRSCANKKAATKHGFSRERLYGIWLGMRKRCYNKESKSYENYGGRGITICDEWGGGEIDTEGYLNFRTWSLNNGYNESLSIDRIDNNAGYSPTNCRWVDFNTQIYNRQNTVLLTIKDITKPLTEWAKDSGVKEATIRRRIKEGWNTEDAVFTPAKADLHA